MNTKIIVSTIKKCVSGASKFLNKHSPTIMVIAGGVGVVTSTILAVKAGKESEEATKAAVENLENVHAMKENIDKEVQVTEENGEQSVVVYTKNDYMRDLAGAYGRLAWSYIKVYGPAALTTAGSLGLIFSSHLEMKKRYATTYAGLMAMSKAYDQYRKHVIEDQGFEADERYRLGLKSITKQEPLFDSKGNPKLDKDGNQKMATKTYNVIDGEYVDDPRTILWAEETAGNSFDTSPDPYVQTAMNKAFIYAAQDAANNILQLRSKDYRNDGIGYIFLNEVRIKLGLKPTQLGNLVGWRYDPRLDERSPKFDPYYKAPDDWGDNCVDFGLENPEIPGYKDRQRFIKGQEEAVVLYMNYDGMIYNKVGINDMSALKFLRRE